MALTTEVVSLFEGHTVLLLIALIALFVVAYRVLKAVINTAIVAVLSGVYLVALNIVGVGPPVNFDNVMLFMVLGTAFFVLYSALELLIATSTSLIDALGTLSHWLAAPFRMLGGDGDDTARTRDTGSSEKEIVLEEVRDE